MAAVVVSVTMRSYKSYFVLILIPYLFLIFMFHTQLQLYDANTLSIANAEGGKLDSSEFAAQSYHVRSLRIKNASFLEDPYRGIRGRRRGNQHRFGAKVNLSHDVVVQGHQTIYYRSANGLGPMEDSQRGHIKVVRHHSNDPDIRFISQQEAKQQWPQPRKPPAAPPGVGGQQMGFLRHNIPKMVMNTSHLLYSLMENAGVHPNAGSVYSDAQWPHCELQGSDPNAQPTEPQLILQNRVSGSTPPLTTPRLPPVTNLRFQSILGNFIYTAFYDNRQPGPVYLRVVALLKKGSKPALFCHFPSDGTGGSEPARVDRHVQTTMLTLYEMCENHAKDYGGWILTCEVPSNLRPSPCEVSVSLHSAYNPRATGNIRVPIMRLRNTPAKKLDFGICVPPLFGYIPSTTLIEFIELTKILGAQHFMFYAHQIPREIQKVLRYYESIGVATVVHWDLPVTDKAIWYHGQLLAINDCLYRSMHKFKYVAFNDIDEFIVPHRHGNWTDMMRHIETSLTGDNKTYSGYSFQSAFFDPLLESSSRVLYDLESDLRTKSFSKVRTKVMVNVEKIHELGIHHISKPVDETHRPLYIEPDIAFLHHYRKCVTDFDPRMNCQVFARDESLSRYIPTLRHNVHQTMWILKEAEKQSHNGDYMMNRGRT